MSGIVVAICETKKNALKKSAFEVATQAAIVAKELGAEAQAIVFGHELTDNLAELGKVGIKKIYTFDAADLGHYHIHTVAPAVRELIAKIKPKVVLSIASLMGKELMPRLAGELRVGLAADVTELKINSGTIQIRRPIYAGKAYIDQSFAAEPPYLISLRPNVFAATTSGNSAAVIEKQTWSAPPNRLGKLKEVQPGQSKRPDLTEADIIVSGGRSLKSADNFKILFDLADVLGAAVGASRAAVDAGYAPHSMQVGQTGKVVSPKLYLAFGISGAIQHLAGMRTSKVIVAINSDPEAPLFKHADYGLVGDLFTFAGEISKSVKKLLG